jgi:cytidyltransferase-like protein
MRRVVVSGAFDEAGSKTLRFLQEAARLGPVTLLLWPDAVVSAIRGTAPKMGLAERKYYYEALSYVDRVDAGDSRGAVPEARSRFDPDRLASWTSGMDAAEVADGAWIWATCPGIGGAAEAANAAKHSWCQGRGMELRDIPESALAGFPYSAPAIGPKREGIKRVVVTGCYDWLHTGHLRFFEEASEYGELNVVIGSDANVRLLKGEGHPLFSEAERSYVAGSFKSVARCLVSSGSGWLDAEPEIRALGIDRYVVNEDGDKPEKRRYCEEKGIEYIVLKRTPKEGLPRRSSTDLRGF